MLYPLADVDWSTAVPAICGVVISVVATLGTAWKFFFAHLTAREEKTQAHESAILARVEVITDQFNETVKQLQRESAATSREQMKTLLGIQRETVQAVGGLATKVGELGQAITELRTEVARKMDRPNGY